MKKMLICLFTLSWVFVAGAQSSYSKYNGSTWEQVKGSGNMIAFEPAITPFTQLEILNANVTVKVITGAALDLMKVVIDDNLRNFFRVQQEGKVLKVYMDLSGGKYQRWISDNHTEVTIYTTTLLSIVNKGNSNLDIQLNGDQSMQISTEGNPDIMLKGKVGQLQLNSEGNADINAGMLEAEQIILNTEGNADFTLNTKELITNSVSGNNEIVNNYGLKNVEKSKESLQESIEPAKFIGFKLRNNSVLPVKLSLISYRPDESGNGTTIFILAPYATKKYHFPAGTKLYLANQEQINVVMSGKRIDKQEPFRIVKNEDDGKIIDIK